MRAQPLAAISQPAPVQTATPPPPPPIIPLVTPAPQVPQVNPAPTPAPRPPQSPRPQTNLSAPRLSTIHDSSEEDVQPARRKLAELDDSSSSSSSDESTEDGRTAVQVVRRRPVNIIRRPRPVARRSRPVPAKGDRLMDPPCERCVKNGRECWTRRHGISACWDCGKMKMKCVPATRDAVPAPAGSQSTGAVNATRQRQGRRHEVPLTSDEESLAESSDSERPTLSAEGKRPARGLGSESEYMEDTVVDVAGPVRITRQQARSGEPAAARPSQLAPAPSRSMSPPRLSRAAKGKGRGIWLPSTYIDSTDT